MLQRHSEDDDDFIWSYFFSDGEGSDDDDNVSHHSHASHSVLSNEYDDVEEEFQEILHITICHYHLQVIENE